jgi:hypothetical protein
VHLAHPLEGDPSRRLHPHHSSELIALRNGLLWAAVPHALWSRPLRAALTLCRGLETLLGRRETSKGDFLRVACAHRAAKSLRSTHRTLQRGRLPGSQMAKVEVEKVGVSQVGGPRGPENKAKTLQKRRIRPPNLEQNRMRRGFSTGCGVLRSSELPWCSGAHNLPFHKSMVQRLHLAPRRREKGKPAARRGRKALGPLFS